ncbi:MAG: hypothetical protein KAS52_06765 [Candidatus Heimdallarchaeota archaeon]|nr:hypothetical protein [Candidatus Heimdallarchaeota archaeon]
MYFACKLSFSKLFVEVIVIIIGVIALIPLGIFVAFLVLAFGYTAYRTKDWKKNVL